MKTDVSDRWSIARSKVENILRDRLNQPPDQQRDADAQKEHLMLVLEIERQRAADRQTEALEKLAKSAEMTSIAFSAVVGEMADLASGMNALAATIKSLGLTVEDLADHDQGELFRFVDDPGPCACGKDHSEVD